MDEIMDKLVEIYQRPPLKGFTFAKGQSVRVRKTLTVDTYFIRELLGAKGTVVDRYTTGLFKENKYVVRFENGRQEVFDESELDLRYAKKVA